MAANLSIGKITGTLELKDDFSSRLSGAPISAIEKIESRAQKMATTLASVGRTAAIALSLPLIAGVGLSVKAASDFESSFAGVRKTVKASEPEFAIMAAQFRGLAKEIPVSVNQLNRLGEAAGQLGIRKENIVSFSKVMAELGTATNLSADMAADSLARFANITQMPQENFEKLGATIVALGNSSAATETDIVEFGLRIAGAGKLAGLTEGQILAIGTAMASVGVEAEAGGTAIQKVLQGMVESVATQNGNLAQFAAAARMSVEDFSTQFKSGSEGAAKSFQMFVEGLAKDGDKAFQTLRNLGFEDVRLTRAFLSLAGAGNVLSDALKVQDKAWKEGTALRKEAEERFKTFASQLFLVKAQVYDLGITIGKQLIPHLKEMLVVVKPVIEGITKGFESLPGPAKTAIFVIAGLLAIGGPLAIAAAATIRALGTIRAAVIALGSAEAIASVATLTKSVLGLSTAVKAGAAVKVAAVGVESAAGLAAIAIASDKVGKSLKFAASEQLGLVFATGQMRDEAGKFIPKIWQAEQRLLPLSGALEQTSVKAVVAGSRLSAFGAAVTKFLGPVGLAVTVLYSLKTAWDMFEEGKGLKAVGSAILPVGLLTTAVEKLRDRFPQLDKAIDNTQTIIKNNLIIAFKSLERAFDIVKNKAVDFATRLLVEFAPGLGRAERVVSVLASSIKSVLIPAIGSAVIQLIAAIPPLRDFLLLASLVPGFGKIGEALDRIAKSTQKTVDELNNVPKVSIFEPLVAGATGGFNALNRFGLGAAAVNDNFAKVDKTMFVFGERAKSTAAIVGGPLADQLSRARNLLKQLNASDLKDLTTAIKSGKFEVEAMAKSYSVLAGAGDLGVMAVKLLQDEIEKTGKVGKASGEEIKNFLDKFSGTDILKAASMWAKALDAPGARVKILASESLRQNLIGALDAVIKRFGSLKAAGLGALQSIYNEAKTIEMALEKIATIPLNPIFSTNTKLLGGGAADLVTQLPQIAQIARPTTLSGNPILPEWSTKNIELNAAQMAQVWITKARSSIFQAPTPKPGAMEKIFGSPKEFGAQLAATVMAAIQGGGSVTGAIGGLLGQKLGTIAGSKVGDWAGKAIGGALGATIGGIAGSALPVIGTLIGSFAGKLIGNLFGPSAYEKRVRENAAQIKALTAEAVKATGSMAILEARAHLVGIQVKEAFKSGSAEFLKKTLDEVTAKFEKLRQKATTEFGNIFKEAERLGFKLPPTLKPYFDEMGKLGLFDEELMSMVERLAGGTEVSFEAMEEAANRYGVRLDALGGAFNISKWTSSVTQILEDWDLMSRGGATMSMVAEDMADEVQAVIDKGMALGQSFPLNLKPIAALLIEKGLLLDANKNKITDINQLKFGDPIVVGLERIALLLEKLIEFFGVKLPAAMNAVPDEIVIEGRLNWRETNKPTIDVGELTPTLLPPVSTAAKGGIIPQYLAEGGIKIKPFTTAQSLKPSISFVPKGSDTQPAMLTPGEMILNEPQQQSFRESMHAAVAGLEAMQRSAVDGGLTNQIEQHINVRVGQDVLAKHSVKGMPRRLTIQGA